MKKREYQVVKRGGKFYPQVRFKFIFWWFWQRIGRHNPGLGFGLYGRSWSGRESTFDIANKIVSDYEEWYKAEKGAKITEIISCKI